MATTPNDIFDQVYFARKPKEDDKTFNERIGQKKQALKKTLESLKNSEGLDAKEIAGKIFFLRDSAGNTPLHRHLEGIYDPEVIDLLLNAGFDIKAQNAQGETLLHVAIRNKQYAAAEDLIKKNMINLNLRDKQGNTFLQLAIKNIKEEDIPEGQSYKFVMMLFRSAVPFEAADFALVLDVMARQNKTRNTQNRLKEENLAKSKTEAHTALSFDKPQREHYSLETFFHHERRLSSLYASTLDASGYPVIVGRSVQEATSKTVWTDLAETLSFETWLYLPSIWSKIPQNFSKITPDNWRNMSGKTLASIPTEALAAMSAKDLGNIPLEVWLKMPGTVWLNMSQTTFAKIPKAISEKVLSASPAPQRIGIMMEGAKGGFLSDIHPSIVNADQLKNMPREVLKKLPKAIWNGLASGIWLKLSDVTLENVPWSKISGYTLSHIPQEFFEKILRADTWEKIPVESLDSIPQAVFSNIKQEIWLKVPKLWDRIPTESWQSVHEKHFSEVLENFEWDEFPLKVLIGVPEKLLKQIPWDQIPEESWDLMNSEFWEKISDTAIKAIKSEIWDSLVKEHKIPEDVIQKRPPLATLGY